MVLSLKLRQSSNLAAKASRGSAVVLLALALPRGAEAQTAEPPTAEAQTAEAQTAEPPTVEPPTAGAQGAPNSADPQVKYEQAERAWLDGRYGESCRGYQELEALTSISISWLGLARCELRSRDLARAREHAASAANELERIVARAGLDTPYADVLKQARELEQLIPRFEAAQKAQATGDIPAYCAVVGELDAPSGEMQERHRADKALWLDLARCAVHAQDFSLGHSLSQRAAAQADLPGQAQAAQALTRRMTGATLGSSNGGGASSPCSAASLTVDGRPALLGQRVQLVAGAHQWELAAPGCQTAQGRFEVVAGPPGHIELPALVPSVSVSPARPSEPALLAPVPAASDRIVQEPVTFWLGAVVATAGGLAAIRSQVKASNRYDQRDEAFERAGCVADPRIGECATDRGRDQIVQDLGPLEEKADQWRGRVWGFGIVGGLGAVAVASSIYFPINTWFESDGAASLGIPTEGLALAISPLPQAPGLCLSGKF